MQMRREVEKIKDNSSASAAAAAMIMLSTTTTITTTTTMATMINMISSKTLDVPSPLKKTRKTSHQRQIDRQNKRKAKEAYTQALA
jgi:ABC-type lipoprotein release transport system permease subunit